MKVMRLVRGNKSCYFNVNFVDLPKNVPHWKNIKTNIKRFYIDTIMIFYMEKTINWFLEVIAQTEPTMVIHWIKTDIECKMSPLIIKKAVMQYNRKLWKVKRLDNQET